MSDYISYIRSKVGCDPINLTGVNVLITNDRGQILLQKRGEFPLKWGLIGGIVELGESLEDACIRETFEETGLHIESNLELVGSTSGKACFVHLPNGHQAFFITLGFHAKYQGQTWVVNGKETKDLKFFSLDSLPDQLVKSHKAMIDQLVVGKRADKR